jgi:hypothetical protein
MRGGDGGQRDAGVLEDLVEPLGFPGTFLNLGAAIAAQFA